LEKGNDMAHSNPITIGMLAHVDAGKTTLSEAILYSAGSIRKLGRVDNQDTFLDTGDMERARGITIFSKQAAYNYNGSSYTLLDTPGHVDFSAETERTLWVLDAAVLVISGMDGVQGHTETLWSLLKRLGIPVFIFVNKMDQQGTNNRKHFSFHNHAAHKDIINMCRFKKLLKCLFMAHCNFFVIYIIKIHA